MAKRVVVIASGETERRALPHLVKHLEAQGVVLSEVRIPPRHSALDPDAAANLIKAAWYSSASQPPGKFVVLLDTDRADPGRIVGRFRQKLPSQLRGIDAPVLYAYAQHHLEAWYFADSQRLSGHLGRNLGSVDLLRPDEIDNPKLHLKHLLGTRAYTARVSERIAAALAPDAITERSPSFARFEAAILNGAAS
jgi:hypothetical protein